MSFDNTKNDIELNGLPYRIKGYQKSELPAFVPRIGGAGQSDTNFDLLQSKTLKSFDGGQLQRYWKEDNSFFASEGLYPVYDDGSLYPVNALTTASTIFGSTKSNVNAHCQNAVYKFWAQRTFNTPTTSIKRMDTAGNVVFITIPVALQNAEVTSMVIWNNELWVATGAAGVLCYMDLGTTSMTQISGGTHNFHLMAVFRDQLYGTEPTVGSINGSILRWTGTKTIRSFLEVGRAPNWNTSNNSKLVNYNNRLILSRNDGLFAYDGIQFQVIENLNDSVDDKNFQHMSILKGYLYYWMPDGMYRFNGSIIEKIYDISEIGVPVDVASGKGRLWILYYNSSNNASRYDKSMGYDYSTGNNVDGRLVAFNGKGMYTYGRTSTFVKNPATDDISDQGRVDKVFHFADKVYISSLFEKTIGNLYYVASTAELALSGDKSWRFVTSIFDADFPMVDKNLENIELVFDGNITADQTINLEYRVSGFDGSTAWASLGSIKTQTELKRQIFKSIPAGISFKKAQFRLVGTTAATYGVVKIIVRYTLSPDVKWQWQFTAICTGDSPTERLQLGDGSSSTLTVQQLRGNIYTARTNDIPIKFVDIDQLRLNGAITNIVTSIVLDSTAFLKGDEGFVQVDDEIMYYYGGKTATTLTVVRGQLGTVAVSHLNDAKVFAVYRAIIRQIQLERVEMIDNPRSKNLDRALSSDISLLLQEV